MSARVCWCIRVRGCLVIATGGSMGDVTAIHPCMIGSANISCRSEGKPEGIHTKKNTG